MKKRSATRYWAIAIWTVLVISLIPVLLIAQYNHGYADDYWYGEYTYHAWKDSHALLPLLQAVGKTVREYYRSWQGTYAAIALFSLQPGIFGEDWYALSTGILLLFLMGSMVYSAVHCGRRLLKASVSECLIVAGVLLLLCVQLMPYPVQGIFWWNGSSYYTVFLALTLIQTANLACYLAQGRCSVWQTGGSMLLGFCIAGGNFVTALLMAEISVLALCVACRRRKVRIAVLLVMLATLAGFLMSTLAPGNANRQAEFDQWPAGKSILYSFHSAYQFLAAYHQPLVTLGMLFLLPFLWQIAKRERRTIRFEQLVLLGILLYCLLASTFTPNLYAYGKDGPGRIINIRFDLMLIFGVVMEWAAVCWLQGALRPEQKAVTLLTQRQRRACVLLFLMLCAFALGNYAVKDQRNHIMAFSAITSLRNGEAAEYDRQLDERTAVYLSDDPVVVFKPLTVKPYLLYFSDISKKQDSWKNMRMARYYDKEQVILQK